MPNCCTVERGADIITMLTVCSSNAGDGTERSGFQYLINTPEGCEKLQE